MLPGGFAVNTHWKVNKLLLGSVLLEPSRVTKDPTTVFWLEPGLAIGTLPDEAPSGAVVAFELFALSELLHALVPPAKAPRTVEHATLFPPPQPTAVKVNIHAKIILA